MAGQADSRLKQSLRDRPDAEALKDHLLRPLRPLVGADLDNPPAKDIAYDTFEQALKNRRVDVEGLRDCYFSPTGSGDTCDFLDEPEVIEALVANGYDSAGFVEWDQYTYVVFSVDQLW